MGWSIGERGRRAAAAANFAMQACGVLLLGFGARALPLWLGCVLFGLGAGNLTSLPPLIVQREFEHGDVAAVVALVIAINQAVFAFAPASFGAWRDTTGNYQIPFAAAAFVQIWAALIILAGRDRQRPAGDA